MRYKPTMIKTTLTMTITDGNVNHPVIADIPTNTSPMIPKIARSFPA
jgi:hypothetical protein